MMKQKAVDSEKQMDEAVRAGDFEALKTAIENGGNVNGRYKSTDKPYLLVVFDSENLENPAWGSVKCCQNRLKMARLLISRGADVNARDKDTITPLYWACQWQNYDVVKQLIDHGAKVNLIEDGHHGLRGNYYPLIMAAQKRKPEIVQLLLDAGAHANVGDEHGNTPLHIACRNGRSNIARLLLEAGADVNARGTGGWTPLHWACFHGHSDTVRHLFAHGVEPHIKDAYGQTALAITLDEFPRPTPEREAILTAFQEHAPEVYFEVFCTQCISPAAR